MKKLGILTHPAFKFICVLFTLWIPTHADTVRPAEASADEKSNVSAAVMMEAYGWELEGAVERLRVLLAAGADANAQNEITGETALLVILRKLNNTYQKPSAKEQAVAMQRVDMVKLLLAAGADPNKRDKAGDSPLPASFDACWLDNFPAESEIIFNALIAAGADPNAGNAQGKTILSRASTEICYLPDRGANVQLLKTLIASGANVNTPDKEKRTPLLLAAKSGLKGNEEVMRTLISAGADVNLPDINGETPLMAAVTSHIAFSFPKANVEMVRLMLDARADVNARNHLGETALMLDVGAPRDAITSQMLIAAGADVNLSNNSGDTALIVAVRAGKTETTIKMLIAAGADVNVTNNSGNTALIMAAKGYDLRPGYNSGDAGVAVVNALVAAGANVRWLNQEDESALTVMATKAGPSGLPSIRALLAAGRRDDAKGYPRVADLLVAIRRAAGLSRADIVQELIAAGADVNGVDEMGRRALNIAVSESGNAGVVRALLKAGARVNARDSNGDTALIGAVREYLPGGEGEVIRTALRRDAEVIRALLAAGADIGARDKDGHTALALAKKSGNQNIIDLLKTAGAR